MDNQPPGFMEPNLLHKAVKFTKHGYILIRTKRKKDNNGEEIIVSIEDTESGITYSDSRPGVFSYVSIFENIWLQTEMYKKVKEAETMQKEFIDIAAHELRNPIQPILILSQLLLSKTGNIEQYGELLEPISRNAKRLNRLAGDILDLTQIESQSLQLHAEQFNLRDMILNTIADSKKEYKDNIGLELVCENDIFVEADRSRLNQVVSNLLNNAIKFTKEGTIITRAEQKDIHVVISVKDTGTGIDPEILPRLFTRFATKSESKTGTGLGLFISKNIVEAHGGRMWAENNSREKGATFTFSLPLGKEKQPPIIIQKMRDNRHPPVYH
jgi:two-component system, OmpR family, sensor histidine kinase VicK